MKLASLVLPRRPAPDRPIFIVGAPRSGTSLLFDILNESAQVASLEGESHLFWDVFHPVKETPTMSHAVDPELITEREQRTLYWAIGTLCGRKRYLDKLPRNCLRIPYLFSLFPSARFVFIRRDGPDTISSMITGWRAGTRFGRPKPPPIPLQIDGYTGTTWKFLMPPGWQRFATGRSLAEVCAFQWQSCVESILAARESIPGDQWIDLRYEELLRSPGAETTRLLRSLALPEENRVIAAAGELNRRMSGTVVTAPRPEKWRTENAVEIEQILPSIEDSRGRLGYL